MIPISPRLWASWAILLSIQLCDLYAFDGNLEVKHPQSPSVLNRRLEVFMPVFRFLDRLIPEVFLTLPLSATVHSLRARAASIAKRRMRAGQRFCVSFTRSSAVIGWN
jgi:hypothetical protein